MEPTETRPRRVIAAYARPEAFAPHVRTILARMGYVIVPAEELESVPDWVPDSHPVLRIVDERQLASVPEDETGTPVPMIVLTGRHGVSGADPRIVGALPRPAGLHELYRLMQQALEETPRGTPRAMVHLAATCRQNGREWRTALLSISENGCLLRSPEPIALGTHVDLCFDLPRVGAVETRAETAYQMPPDLGMIFHETPAAVRRAISEFVTAQLAQG
jgi:hypothetical protein